MPSKPAILGLLFGIAVFIIGFAADLEWLSGTVLSVCLIGWLVLEIRERQSEGVLTVLGVLFGIAMIYIAAVADVEWLNWAVVILAVIGWLVLVTRDRRPT
jgi:hypothetical protein